MIRPIQTTREDQVGARQRRGGGQPRFLLYSHDSWGLGHLRRNLTLATALRRRIPGSSVLIVTGSPCATFFRSPRGIEILKLPSVTKDRDGNYVPRQLPGPLSFTLTLRRRILLEAFRTYSPDLVLVDHQVTGLHGEILDVLREARDRGIRTMLGIRDIIDTPEAVAREWGGRDKRWALAEGYDRVCVYGSPEVFDPRIEYPIPPELTRSVEFTGYVVRDVESKTTGSPVPSDVPNVLVTTGGGEDGEARIEAYMDAIALGGANWKSVIVAGPLLPTRRAKELKRRAAGLGNVEVHRFHADLPHLMAQSDAIVAMAGYNTSTEIMQSGKPAVFMPRTHPRREQAIRAERLQRLGIGQSVEELDPGKVREAVETALRSDGTRSSCPPLDGRDNLCRIVAELLDVPLRESAPVEAGVVA